MKEFAAELQASWARSCHLAVAQNEARRRLRTCGSASAIRPRRSFGPQSNGEIEKCLPIIEARAEIAESTGTERVFNMRLDPGATLGDVLAAWRLDHRGDGAAGGSPAWSNRSWQRSPARFVPSNGRLRDYGGSGGSAVCRGLSTGRDGIRVRRVHRAVRAAASRHGQDDHVKQMYLKDAAVEPLEQIQLMAVLKDMKERKRPPSDSRQPASAVHRARGDDQQVHRPGHATGSVDTAFKTS